MSTKIYFEQEGVSDTDAEVINLFYQDFDEVEKGAIIAEIETSKVVVEIEANQDGYIKNIAQLNGTIEVGDLIVVISEDVEELKKESFQEEKVQDILEVVEKNISAKTLKIAKSLGITEDILKEQNIKTVEELNVYIANNQDKGDSFLNEDFVAKYNLEDVSRKKYSEIENLRLALSKTLPCSCSIVIENFDVDSFSKDQGLYFNNIFPAVAKICSEELKAYKNLNGFFHDKKKCFYEEVNIGFTLDADEYLQVPVVHNCENLNQDDIQNTFVELLTASVKGKITLNQMSKPTFVISDLSAVGDCSSHTPLLAPYTSGILGLAIDKKTSRLSLNLTYDHQMSSGKEALLFLEAIRSKLSS
jgi:2-oxoglutarate dehydrogenase E2 component (dihydrolipoamide succinyltransferase)